MGLTIKVFLEFIIEGAQDNELAHRLLSKINYCIQRYYPLLEDLTDEDIEDIYDRIWSLYKPREQMGMKDNNIKHDVARCHACRYGVCSY